MANVITVDELAAEVNRVLDRYSEVTYEELQRVTDRISKETVANLKATSPKDTGAYAKAWTSSRDPWLKRKGSYGRVAHVKAPHYRLTHLLEFGHDIVRGGRRVGRTAAQPHIAPASEKAVRDFERELLQGIEGIDI